MVMLIERVYSFKGSRKMLSLMIRQVVIAKEAGGNLGLMVRQLSLEHFENESRRMVPIHNDQSYPTKKITRQRSPQGLHKKASISLLYALPYISLSPHPFWCLPRISETHDSIFIILYFLADYF